MWLILFEKSHVSDSPVCKSGQQLVYEAGKDEQVITVKTYEFEN